MQSESINGMVETAIHGGKAHDVDTSQACQVSHGHSLFFQGPNVAVFIFSGLLGHYLNNTVV